jgi:hypothetical protein
MHQHRPPLQWVGKIVTLAAVLESALALHDALQTLQG